MKTSTEINGSRYLFQHFLDGRPTKENPDPEPAIRYDFVTPARKPPKLRALSEHARKRRKLDVEINETNKR